MGYWIEVVEVQSEHISKQEIACPEIHPYGEHAKTFPAVPRELSPDRLRFLKAAISDQEFADPKRFSAGE